MYPNLYYVLKDWFGVEWHNLSFVNMFGLMVALAFIAAAVVINKELQRKEKMGLLIPMEETIEVGKPASIAEIITNAVMGFFMGFKLLGIFVHKPAELDASSYIFSKDGFWIGGLLLAAAFGFQKWYEGNKRKLAVPEKRTVRIWPHDRVGDIIVLGLIFGILGAKLFDAIENMDQLLAHPVDTLFSRSGLTFYGGLILATVVICLYALKKRIKLIHLVDSAAPALMIAYAIGRLGCQISGDGDWGVYNSAYTIDSTTHKVVLAKPGDFEATKQQYASYFLQGKLPDANLYNGRTASALENVGHKHVVAPAFLPTWMVAYTYPKNVNADGIVIPGDKDEHNRQLPIPVLPTPLYETLICALFFGLMMLFRRKITVPGLMFGIYLILNGVERFFVERIRVNDQYDTGGVSLSQAQIIAVGLIVAGLVLSVVMLLKSKKGPDNDIA